MRPADAVRRSIDVAVACVGLVVTCPVMLLAAVAVRTSLGRGVLFRQQRLGLGGRPFCLLKFRTMRHAQPGRDAPTFDGERLTRLGSWLRASSIDELPSLWNLLRGDIALVGPRPLPVHYWHRFRDDEYQRFEVRPGISGLAQVSGRNGVDWDERLALDVQYVRTRTLGGDLRILVRTVPTVLGRAGVAHHGSATMHALPEDRVERQPR
jgi:lipopolysaccharide/colanic/teichoic acid biosynthesis glycosyltransferase